MGQQILVVDDDPAITSVLRRGLTYEGYHVLTAQDGPDGLAQAREQAPELVILDIMMPGLDGWEVLRRLRAADATLPVLFLTAKDAPADQAQGLNAGADDYVVKPKTSSWSAAGATTLAVTAMSWRSTSSNCGRRFNRTANHASSSRSAMSAMYCAKKTRATPR